MTLRSIRRRHLRCLLRSESHRAAEFRPGPECQAGEDGEVVDIANRLRSATFADGMRLGLAIGGVLAAVWSLSLFPIATVGGLVARAFAVMWLALLVVGSAIAASGLGRDIAWTGAFEVIACPLQHRGADKLHEFTKKRQPPRGSHHEIHPGDRRRTTCTNDSGQQVKVPHHIHIRRSA